MKKSRFINFLFFGIAITLIMYVFFVNIKPIMVCDPDDWTYIGYIRKPIPIWKDWNPAKVVDLW